MLDTIINYVTMAISFLSNTSLFLIMVIAMAVGLTVDSPTLKRDSVSFLLVILFFLVLSR